MLLESTPSRPHSQHKMNKLLEKDLKQIILSLDPNELISLFRNLEIGTQMTSFKQFTKIGLKCSECHTKFDTFQSKGYGRDEHEALINSLKIILESMISSNYRIETIKKAIKYSSKFKQPLINFSQQSSQQSSTKKSSKKVEGIDSNIKSMKKYLQFDSIHDNDKENISMRMNQESTSFSNQMNIKMSKASEDILLMGNFDKLKDKRASSPAIIIQKVQSTSDENVQKCFHSKDSKKCIFYEIQLNSEEQIKSLNARIKLLEEENSILKELLLKDFNKNSDDKSKNIEKNQSNLQIIPQHKQN